MQNGQYYYYYTMPDGTYGYVQPADVFTPRDNSEQPNGYQQGAYGQGTGYQAPAPLYYYDANTGCYYTYENTAPQEEYSAEPAAVEAVASPPAALAAAQQQANHPNDGFYYVPPTNYNDIKQWRGTQSWAQSPCSSCCDHPCYCLGACLCPWCFVIVQRKRLLLNDWSNYICCAGVCGQHSCCDCSGCCLMCCEATCCLPCSFHGNRFMLMKHYGLKPSSYDRFISHVSCVCAVFRCCSDWSPICCDCCYVPVMCCLLTQQQHQMETLEYPKVEVMQ